MGGAHKVDICIITPLCGYYAVTSGEQLCEPNIALLKENGKSGFRQLGARLRNLKVQFVK